MGGRRVSRGHTGVQRGLLVHQRRAAAHRAAEAARALYTNPLRYVEVRGHDRGSRGVYTIVVERMDAAVGGERRVAAASVSGESAVVQGSGVPVPVQSSYSRTNGGSKMRAYILAGLIAAGV